MLRIKFGFGTSRLHHVFSKKKRDLLIDCALDLGILHFDTSPYYGDGFAESFLGSCNRLRCGNVTITSKAGLYPKLFHCSTISGIVCKRAVVSGFPSLSKPKVSFRVHDIEKSLFKSLRALKRDYLDFFLLHEPMANGIESWSDELNAWLLDRQARGYFREFGLAGSLQNSCSGNLLRPMGNIIQTDLRSARSFMELNADVQPDFLYGLFSFMTQSSVRDIVSYARLFNQGACQLVSSTKSDNLISLIKEFDAQK